MNLATAMRAYAHNDKEHFPCMNGADDNERPSSLFYADFSVADCWGASAVIDTYNRAQEWKNDVKMFTELVIVLNHKIWEYYQNNDKLARLYDRLWREASEYACENFKGDDAKYYYTITD